MKQAIGYSYLPLNKIISVCASICPGVSIDLCSATWKRNKCERQGKRCVCLLPDGTSNIDRVLAKKFKKSIRKLTYHDRHERAEKLERVAYDNCKPIGVKVF